jgi:hypothetical protein
MTFFLVGALALFACTQETDDDGGETDDDGGSGAGTSGGVSDCDDLCALAPVNSDVGSCVTSYIAAKGYNVSDPACGNANTPSGCNACYDAIAVSDADCVAVHNACF